MAAEQLRATLQSEWQQLKAIRKRCCTSVSEVILTLTSCRKSHSCIRVNIVPDSCFVADCAAICVCSCEADKLI